MASITIKNLGKVYAGHVRAVEDINLDIMDGEFIVLVGPSGCGKSTLLRMIAGLETITEGDLHIGEKRVNGLEPAERDIAMVFQNYALYPHMTVFKNLAYGLKNRGFPKEEIDQRVQKTAKMLEIGEFLDRKPRALSGGQRQRVAMGRALVREPTAFLLDEPLSNLDAKLRVQMRLEIKQLQRRLKTTSLYVTHDQLEAMTLGDRLVVLNKGKVEQVGSPIDVYDRPESLFVAEFIGSPSMNMISLAELTGQTNDDAVRHLPEGTDILGLRPDQLLFEAPNAPHVRLDCTVILYEPAGAESHLYLQLQSNKQSITMRVHGEPPVHEGGDVSIYAPVSAGHPFNQTSRRRTD